MPAGFTKEFAASLDRICPLSVKEAEDGDLIHPGQIYVAPGDYHIVVEKSSLCNVIRLEQSALRNGHRPSADVLFESVAKIYQNRALGVIMTGMGRDGAEGCKMILDNGGYTIVEDKSTCAVFGMPAAAIELNAASEVLPRTKIAERVLSLV